MKGPSDRRSIKLANFCGRGVVARENRPIKSLTHDTRPILSFATSYDIRYIFMNAQQQNADRKMILALLFFRQLMTVNKNLE